MPRAGARVRGTVLTVDPSSTLTEGHYTLSLNGVKSADEGLTFSGSASYAVPFAESGSIGPATVTMIQCTANPSSTGVSTSTPFSVAASDSGPDAFLDFDLAFSGPGGWDIQALLNGNPAGSVLQGAAGGHYRLNFPISGGGQVSFRLTVHCGGSTTASASNLFGSRYP